MQRKMMLFSAAGAALILAGSAAFFYGESVGATNDSDNGDAQAMQGPPPANVAVARVEARSIAPRAEAPGSIVSVRDSLVAAATSGKITWVAEVGAEVETGETIARIDPADATFARDNSLADMRRLQARADYVESLYNRFMSLGDDGGESQASLDEMRANRDQAAQALAQAAVAVQRAETDLERTEVKAPFAGRIVSQESQIGEFANPGVGVIRLVDTHSLEVTARAPAALARNIEPGDTVKVSYGAETLDAELRAVVPVGDERSRMLELRLALPQSNWYIGSAVRVSLPAAAERIVTAAPRDALVLRADRISVFIIGEDNIAKQVNVELGSAEGDFIEIIGDINPGESIVIRGGERLRDGQPVNISTLNSEASA